MNIFFLILHLIVTTTLIGLILLQSSKGGLGGGMGGGEFYRTKRGAEKIVFNATVVTAVLFLCTSIINIMVR
ncbi:MAG: preprotein translocase subunit SecG [Patescibacteria group bacterium]